MKEVFKINTPGVEGNKHNFKRKRRHAHKWVFHGGGILCIDCGEKRRVYEFNLNK